MARRLAVDGHRTTASAHRRGRAVVAGIDLGLWQQGPTAAATPLPGTAPAHAGAALRALARTLPIGRARLSSVARIRLHPLLQHRHRLAQRRQRRRHRSDQQLALRNGERLGHRIDRRPRAALASTVTAPAQSLRSNSSTCKRNFIPVPRPLQDRRCWASGRGVKAHPIEAGSAAKNATPNASCARSARRAASSACKGRSRNGVDCFKRRWSRGSDGVGGCDAGRRCACRVLAPTRAMG